MKELIILMAAFMIAMPLASAAVSVGKYSGNPEVVIAAPTAAINYSIINTNSSYFWGTYLYSDYAMATIKSFAYNHTTAAYGMCMNNESYLSTYNATYAQTTANLNGNHTAYLSTYNSSYVLDTGDTMTGMLNVTIAPQSYVQCSSSMVSYWKAENDANDYFGINNGTANVNVSYVAGKIGNAFKINSMYGRVNISASPSINQSFNGNNFTILLWAKPSDKAINPTHVEQGVLIDHPYTSHVAPHYDFRFGMDLAPAADYDNEWDAEFINSAGSNYYRQSYSANELAFKDVWSFLAVTWNGLTLSLYQNGTLLASDDAGVGSKAYYNTGMAIGNLLNSPDVGFNGTIDEVALFNRTLSSTEILDYYSRSNSGLDYCNYTYGITTYTSIWAGNNISAAGYVTRTSVYDAEKEGSALSKIHDYKDYLFPDGSVNHEAFGFSYVYEEGIIGYTTEKQLVQECSGGTINADGTVDGEATCKEILVDVQVPVYDKTNEGVLLDSEVALLKQAIYELKSELCVWNKDYNFCGDGT